MFEILLYKPDLKALWNQYVDYSKNGTFLFRREYMDYHADRFEDHSLMIYRKGKLYALLPANRVNDTLYSHQGLTYGGLVTSFEATTVEILEVFCQINNYLRANGFKKVIYKAMPFIYHIHPAQEDLYALFKISHAQLIGRNISSTIFQSNKIKFIESRKSGIRKANRSGITIKESDDFVSFWEILDTNLKNKYGIAPVHSLAEIELLHSLFPQNIKLYLVYQDDMPLGGTVIYKTQQVIHTQYISASLKGKELGVLDLLFDYLINSEYASYPYFDFGQSTEQMGSVLNESLIFQKEGFGGRGVMYDIYEYDII